MSGFTGIGGWWDWECGNCGARGQTHLEAGDEAYADHECEEGNR